MKASVERKPTVENHKHGEAVDVACEAIRRGIITGRFAPGQRLILRDLMEDIGFSASTLREAFRRLAAERLVNLIPNRGIAVHRLTQKEMADLFEIRELLEGTAARLAAERIDEGDHRKRFLAMWARVRRGNP